METNCKIAVKHWINNNPELAQGLKRGSDRLDTSIKELSLKTSLNESFLRMNIDQIRNWID